MKPIRCLEYVNGKLHCEGVPLGRIAESFGTPCYVYSKQAITSNLDALLKAFPPDYAEICYAVKANSNLTILDILGSRGVGFDIVSGGELFRLRKIGIPASRIIFSGVGKTVAEIDWAIKAGVFSIGVESLEELRIISERATALRSSAVISLRLNLDIEAETHPGIATGGRKHKFGLDSDLLAEAVLILKKNPLLKLKGIGAHIGSQIMDANPYIRSFEALKKCAASLEAGHLDVEFLDIGGGFGIPYQDGIEPFPLSELASQLAARRGPYRIVLEPGRYIVGPAGVLISKVTLSKKTGGRKFIVLDAGMNDLIRPALYQARHQFLPEREGMGKIETADVVGPICETTDRFAEKLDLPPLADGELTALLEAGAYGSVLSSNYNTRPRPAEILVDGTDMRLVRKRETLEGLVEDELI